MKNDLGVRLKNLANRPLMIESCVLDACEEFFTVHTNDFLDMEKLSEKEVRKFGLFNKIDYDKCIASMAYVGERLVKTAEKLAEHIQSARANSPRIVYDEDDPLKSFYEKLGDENDRIDDFENSVLNIYFGLMCLIESKIKEYQMLKAKAERNNRIPFNKYSEQLKTTQKIRDKLNFEMEQVSAVYLPLREEIRSKNAIQKPLKDKQKENNRIKEYIDQTLIWKNDIADKDLVTTYLINNYKQYVADKDLSKLLDGLQYENLKRLIAQDIYRLLIKRITTSLGEIKIIRDKIASNQELLKYEQRENVSLSEFLELLDENICNCCDKDQFSQFQQKVG